MGHIEIVAFLMHIKHEICMVRLSRKFLKGKCDNPFSLTGRTPQVVLIVPLNFLIDFLFDVTDLHRVTTSHDFLK